MPLTEPPCTPPKRAHKSTAMTARILPNDTRSIAKPPSASISTQPVITKQAVSCPVNAARERLSPASLTDTEKKYAAAPASVASMIQLANCDIVLVLPNSSATPVAKIGMNAAKGGNRRL